MCVIKQPGYNFHLTGVAVLIYDYGQGIWCGIVFGLNGLLGISCAKSPTLLKIKSFVGTNVISLAFTLLLGSIAGWNAYKVRMIQSVSIFTRNSVEDTNTRILFILFNMQIVISFIHFILVFLSLISILIMSCIRSRSKYFRSKDNANIKLDIYVSEWQV